MANMLKALLSGEPIELPPIPCGMCVGELAAFSTEDQVCHALATSMVGSEPATAVTLIMGTPMCTLHAARFAGALNVWASNERA